MKLEPVTKLDKESTATSKILTYTSYQQNVTSLLFLQFMANFEQSGSRSPVASYVKCTFSSVVTFYLTKTENKTKKYLTQLSYNCFE